MVENPKGRTPIVARLSLPLEERIEAAYYLGQAMKLSRQPGSTVLGMGFYGDGEGAGAVFFEQPVQATEEIRRLDHNAKMRALAPAFHELEEAVEKSLGTKNIDFIVLGGVGPVTDKEFYAGGEQIAAWMPSNVLAQGELTSLK
ncbi:MAG: hypothetical protein ACM3IJ_05365 [Candidatus Levyibacteriota bacterium]